MSEVFESNKKIWSNEDTARSLGYDKVEHPMSPLIKGSQILSSLKDYIKEISPKKEVSVLDIGGGNGRKYYYLKKHIFKDIEFNYTVIDINQLCIRTGSDHFKDNDKVKFIHGDITSHIFDSKMYDICIIDSVLCYVSSPWQLLLQVFEMSRWLLLLRTGVAIPQVYSFTNEGIKEGDFNFISDENYYAMVAKEASWGGESGASYVFPPEIYGLLFSHPKTRKLSSSFEFPPPIIEHTTHFTQGHKRDVSWKKHFSEFFISNIKKLLKDNLFLKKGPSTQEFLKNHSCTDFTACDAEFFVEIHQ